MAIAAASLARLRPAEVAAGFRALEEQLGAELAAAAVRVTGQSVYLVGWHWRCGPWCGPDGVHAEYLEVIDRSAGDVAAALAAHVREAAGAAYVDHRPAARPAGAWRVRARHIVRVGADGCGRPLVPVFATTDEPGPGERQGFLVTFRTPLDFGRAREVVLAAALAARGGQ